MGTGSLVTSCEAGEGIREKQIAGLLKKRICVRKRCLCAFCVAGFGLMCAAGAVLHRAFLWLYNFSPSTKIVKKLFSPSNQGESECQSFSVSSWAP